MTEATEETKVLKDKLAALPKIRDLSPLEKQQLEYLIKEYPTLDSYMLETCLRLSDKARDEICADIKSGALKIKDTEEGEQKKIETILKAVDII